jgi:hypothetical protein
VDDDPEIKAMQVAAGAINALEDEAARARVIEWVARRFGVSVRLATAAMTGAAVGAGAAYGAITESFADFADLLGAANPRTDVERALVGGYWFQAIKEAASFNAQDVNTELKNAGQGVKNITDALAGLIGRRPQLVLQVAKTGRTRQARKTYKLTTAGITSVRQMIQRSANGADE